MELSENTFLFFVIDRKSSALLYLNVSITNHFFYWSSVYVLTDYSNIKGTCSTFLTVQVGFITFDFSISWYKCVPWWRVTCYVDHTTSLYKMSLIHPSNWGCLSASINWAWLRANYVWRFDWKKQQDMKSINQSSGIVAATEVQRYQIWLNQIKSNQFSFWVASCWW